MDRPRVNYDELASAYDARYAADELAGIGEALRAVVKQTRAERVLEVGCGTGRWLSELAPHTQFVAGVDRSVRMLALAAAKLNAGNLVNADANALPFPSGCFDLVFAVNAIHHFADARGFIPGAANLLAPGGALAIVGIDPRLIRRRYFYACFEGSYESDLQRFPAVGDIVNWMAAAGFSRIEYRIADRYQRIFRGAAVRSDPFLKKNSNSLLAMLSDADYEGGLRRIEDAIARDAEFVSDIAFPLVVAFTQPPA
jgi:SAM-dependent methyltransferase